MGSESRWWNSLDGHSIAVAHLSRAIFLLQQFIIALIFAHKFGLCYFMKSGYVTWSSVLAWDNLAAVSGDCGRNALST